MDKGQPWFARARVGFPIPNTWQGMTAMMVYLFSLFMTRPILTLIFGFTWTTAVASPTIMLLLTVGYVIMSYAKSSKAPPE